MSIRNCVQNKYEFWIRHLARKSFAFELDPPIPRFETRHVANARIVPSRYELLDHLPKNEVVTEVGVLYGDFSAEILRRTSPKELHLIDRVDLWGTRFQQEKVPVISHIGDSSTTLSTFPDEYFGWIYIDAEHEYEGVVADINVAKRKVRADGYLVFNDFMCFSPLELQKYGVYRAVSELCVNESWEIVFLALQQSCYFDVAIRRL